MFRKTKSITVRIINAMIRTGISGTFLYESLSHKRSLKFLRGCIMVIICCVLYNPASCQDESNCMCDSLLIRISEPVLIGDVFIKPLPSTVSQFFNNDWLKGEIFLSNHVNVVKQRLRYNGYIDRLIWMNEKYQMVKLDKEPVDGFCLQDRLIPGLKYCFGKIKIKEEFASDSSMVYAQKLHTGNPSLYVYRKVIRYGMEELGELRIMVDAYEKRNFYYFMSGNHMEKGFVKINRRNILDIFPDRKNEITGYLRRGRHSLRTEEDLKDLTRFLNGK